MIKRASASAGVLHFLFHAEGRVAPERQSPLQSRQATGGDLCQPGAAGLFNGPRERQGHPGVTVSLGSLGSGRWVVWRFGVGCLGVGWHGPRWALGAIGRRRRGLRPSGSGACFGGHAKVRVRVSSANPSRPGGRRWVGVGWRALGRWALGERQGRPRGRRRRRAHFWGLSGLHPCPYAYESLHCTGSGRTAAVDLATAGRWVGVGCLGVGWALGVGWTAGSPPGCRKNWALGRRPAAGFAPRWLAHSFPPSPPPLTSPPPPKSPASPPNRDFRRLRPRKTPKNPA